MAAIKSADTKPEIYVRRTLHAAGFRFRLHPKNLPGKPDLVLPRYKTAVLVHGCFWHGHGCKADHKPKTNTSYWSAKIGRNIERDKRNRSALEAAGWQVYEIWECDAAGATHELTKILREARSAQKPHK